MRGLPKPLSTLFVAFVALAAGQAHAAPAAACTGSEVQQSFSFPAGTWTDGTLGPYTYTVGTGADAVTLTFTSNNTGGRAFANASPYQAQRGNLNDSVTHEHNGAPANSLLSTFSVSANRPLNKLQYVAADVDYTTGGGGWQDQIISTANNGSSVFPTAMTGGVRHTINVATGTATATTTTNCADTDASCNVTMGYNLSNITSTTMQFRNGGLAAATQWVGWNDFEWCLPPAPDLSITKTDGATFISPGSAVTYTIVVSSVGSVAVNNAVFTDPAVANLTVSSVTCGSVTGGASCPAVPSTTVALMQGSGIVIPSLPVSSSVTFTVIGTAGASGSIANTATITMPAGVTDPTAANNSATDTDAIVVLAGRVYEDVNYGGGSGRSYAASGGVTVPNARVELYNSSGNFVSFTTTDASGNYGFGSISNGNYTVRVVNNSVASTRAGACAAGTCLPVQTWRTDASSGAATAVTDRVGGENPSLVDAGNGSTTLAALTTGSTTPQSITSVAYSGTLVSGVDFGYNFDTIVNVNDAGQGSLRQFVTNANALGGDGSLAQSGNRIDLVTGSTVALTGGVEQTIFMISDGAAHAGLRAGLTSQLTSGVAIIPIVTTLSSLSTAMRIEGGTQTYNVGNTNNVTLGAGGTVGAGATTLPQINGPEVQLQDGPAGATGVNYGLQITANNVTVRGMSIVGFGDSGNTATDAHGNIYVNNTTGGVLISQNAIGITATSMANPGTLITYGDNIRIGGGNGGDSGTISQNIIAYSDGNGIGFDTNDNTDGWTVEYNEIRGNGVSNAARNGIELDQNTAGAANTIRYNLIVANNGAGIDLSSNNADNNTITQNTITANGNATEPGGLRDNSGDNNTISLNIIHTNTGPGIEFLAGSSGNIVSQNRIYSNTQSGIEVDDGDGTDTNTNTITQNSIYGNTRIGIDLLLNAQNGTPASPYYTQNDNVDGDAGGNTLLNFPQITSATALGSNMTVAGIAPAGATVEIFISDGDATGFGEGQTYLVTYVEGSVNDTASGTSANTVTCGTGAVSVTMNNFSFTFPKPGSVSNGTLITSTATLTNNTSEFSCNATVVDNSPSLVFLKTLSTYSDPVNGTSTPYNIPGAYIDYTLRVTNTGNGTADNLTIVDPIPANAELFTGNLSGGAPFIFTDSSAPTSGLSCGFTALGNFADCVDFSIDGTNWNTYTPNGTFDPAVTHIRFKPVTTMNADTPVGSPSPYFDITFRVRIK